MVVASLEVQLRLEGCRSLKEKRRRLRPLIERLRRDLSVSVAEVDDHDLWNVATVGVACVARDRATASALVDQALERIELFSEVRVQSVRRDCS